MAIIAPEHGGNNSGAVQRKSNVTRKLKVSNPQKKAATAGGAPEVMAKVTGFSKGKSHAKSHIDYISRNGDLELETDRGEVIKGRTDIKSFAKDWTQEFGDKKTYKNQRDTAHIVLSMPPGTDPEAVKNATRNFAKQTFGANHEYVFALHTDTKSPHCHLTVKCLGNDGTRLNPRKADLQRYREDFANAMEQQGVAANATPRKVRGVVKKPERQVIRHIEERGTSKVKAMKIKELAEELSAEAQGRPSKPKPWVQKIEAAQARIRSAWLATADALSKQPAERDYTHERPDYNRVDPGRARQLQRTAGLHQSRDYAPGGSGSARTLASMRNLSGLAVVQNQAPTEMLLHKDARNRLADRDGRAASDDLRRSGNGPASVAGGPGRLEAGQPSRIDDKALAARIKSFVEAMPPIETERDQLKKELVREFSKEKRKDSVQTVETSNAPARQEHKSSTATREVDKDIDR
jgi:type IV secretory pathway VirD2 relaxase